ALEAWRAQTSPCSPRGMDAEAAPAATYQLLDDSPYLGHRLTRLAVLHRLEEAERLGVGQASLERLDENGLILTEPDRTDVGQAAGEPLLVIIDMLAPGRISRHHDRQPPRPARLDDRRRSPVRDHQGGAGDSGMDLLVVEEVDRARHLWPAAVAVLHDHARPLATRSVPPLQPAHQAIKLVNIGSHHYEDGGGEDPVDLIGRGRRTGHSSRPTTVASG